MPTISMFYGILVTILFEDNERHHLPHFHVRYQNFKASIAIEDGRVLAGLSTQAVEVGAGVA